MKSIKVTEQQIIGEITKSNYHAVSDFLLRKFGAEVAVGYSYLKKLFNINLDFEFEPEELPYMLYPIKKLTDRNIDPDSLLKILVEINYIETKEINEKIYIKITNEYEQELYLLLQKMN